MKHIFKWKEKYCSMYIKYVKVCFKNYLKIITTAIYQEELIYKGIQQF